MRNGKVTFAKNGISRDVKKKAIYLGHNVKKTLGKHSGRKQVQLTSLLIRRENWKTSKPSGWCHLM